VSRSVSSAVTTSCGKSTRDDIQIFPVTGISPNGNKTIVLYNVLYNRTRGLPISTTAFHDSLNKEDASDRGDDFRKYSCPQLTDNKIQADCSRSYKMTVEQQSLSGRRSFDRGNKLLVRGSHTLFYQILGSLKHSFFFL
jgi:hypothetical protein